MRHRASKEQVSSKLESLKDNPEGDDESKVKTGVKKMTQRVQTLKRDQNKLKNTLQK